MPQRMHGTLKTSLPPKSACHVINTKLCKKYLSVPRTYNTISFLIALSFGCSLAEMSLQRSRLWQGELTTRRDIQSPSALYMVAWDSTCKLRFLVRDFHSVLMAVLRRAHCAPRLFVHTAPIRCNHSALSSTTCNAKTRRQYHDALGNIFRLLLSLHIIFIQFKIHCLVKRILRTNIRYCGFKEWNSY